MRAGPRSPVSLGAAEPPRGPFCPLRGCCCRLPWSTPALPHRRQPPLRGGAPAPRGGHRCAPRLRPLPARGRLRLRPRTCGGAACPPSAARAPLLCSGVACSPIRAAAGSASPWRGGGANAWPFFPRGAPARPPAAAASGGSITRAAGRAIWAAAPRASRGSPRGAPVELPAPLAGWCCRSPLPCAPPPRRPRWGLRGARGLLCRGAAAPRASAAPPGAPAPPPVFSLSHRRQGSPAARPAALTAARSVFRPPGLTSPAGCAIILVRGLLTAPLGASLVESVVQDGCPVERPGSFFESTLSSNCYLMRPNATKHLYFVAFVHFNCSREFETAFRPPPVAAALPSGCGIVPAAA